MAQLFLLPRLVSSLGFSSISYHPYLLNYDQSVVSIYAYLLNFNFLVYGLPRHIDQTTLTYLSSDNDTRRWLT